MKLLPRTHDWPEGVHPLALFNKDLQLKAHAAYPRANAGDETAALDMLLDTAVAWLDEHRARFAPGLFAELANYIQHGGGKIQDVVVLVNAGRNPALVPQPKNVQLLNRRFGDEIFNIFGIKPEALSANEAQYLVGFRSVDEIRNRLAAARQEIDRRLRSKGIARAFEGTAAGLHAVQGLSGAGTPVPGSHNKPHPRGS